mmetsp:Transcript_33886/g.67325  ORF Transcript_33886/g.67325 Transcript_33886/m.67325 type:complete len:264 (+) Transcript_33886:502-1293(+)
MHRQGHRHHPFFPVGRVIDQLPGAIVSNHAQSVGQRHRRPELVEDRLMVKLHNTAQPCPDCDGMPLQESAANDDLIRGRKSMGVIRPHEATLNAHPIGLDNPELTVAIVAGTAAIKGPDMRIAPELALADVRLWRRGRRGRREWHCRCLVRLVQHLRRRRRRRRPAHCVLQQWDGHGCRGLLRRFEQEDSDDQREDSDHHWHHQQRAMGEARTRRRRRRAAQRRRDGKVAVDSAFRRLVRVRAALLEIRAFEPDGLVDVPRTA